MRTSNPPISPQRPSKTHCTAVHETVTTVAQTTHTLRTIHSHATQIVSTMVWYAAQTVEVTVLHPTQTVLTTHTSALQKNLHGCHVQHR